MFPPLSNGSNFQYSDLQNKSQCLCCSGFRFSLLQESVINRHPCKQDWKIRKNWDEQHFSRRQGSCSPNPLAEKIWSSQQWFFVLSLACRAITSCRRILKENCWRRTYIMTTLTQFFSSLVNAFVVPDYAKIYYEDPLLIDIRTNKTERLTSVDMNCTFPEFKAPAVPTLWQKKSLPFCWMSS